ncbi:hypothetical protein AB0M46_17345 [Dactylosporangium sp. NPDC051485]|uniref:hypothetical protein n=1 Tax=Dactylosporangium sp. NPDC051485 TaxID=3154846 RepID=UPI003416BFAA
MTATVMRRLAQLLHDVWYTLEPTGAGSIRVAAHAVAILARDAVCAAAPRAATQQGQARSSCTSPVPRAPLRRNPWGQYPSM